MIRFEHPSKATLLPFLKMRVTPAQEAARLVAPNAVTLAQAAYEPGSEVWFIYEDDTPLGLMALVDFGHKDADLDTGDDANGLYLWRLFIDAPHQGQGYGRAALDFAKQRAKDLARPNLYLSYMQGPESPSAFYAKHGFTPTGRIVDGETECVLALP